MHYLLFYTSAAKHLAHLSSSAESTAHNLLSSVWREKVEEDLSLVGTHVTGKYSQRADHSVRNWLDGSKESRHQAPLSELTGTRYRWVLRWLEERRGISDSSTARRRYLVRALELHRAIIRFAISVIWLFVVLSESCWCCSTGGSCGHQGRRQLLQLPGRVLAASQRPERSHHQVQPLQQVGLSFNSYRAVLKYLLFTYKRSVYC